MAVSEVRPGSEYFDIALTTDGQVIVAGKGVYLLNGDEWHPAPLPRGIYRGIAPHSDGSTVWVSGDSSAGYLTLLNNGWQYTDLRAALGDFFSHETLWDVFATGDGQALFVAVQSLMYWNGSEFERINLPSPRRLQSFRNGTDIWIHQYGTGLHRWSGDGIVETIPEPPGLKDRMIHAEGNVFYSMDGSTWRHENGEWHEGLHPYIKHGDPFVLGITQVNSELRAVATFRNGLILTNTEGDPIPVTDELPANEVRDILVDPTGTLWAAAVNGLYRMEVPGAFARVEFGEGGSETPRTIFQLDEDSLLVSTISSLYRVEDAEALSIEADWLYSSLIIPVIEHAGRIWMGLLRGIAIMEDGTATEFPFEYELLSLAPVSGDPQAVLFGQLGKLGIARLKDEAPGIEIQYLGDFPDWVQQITTHGGAAYVSVYRNGLWKVDPNATDLTPELILSDADVRISSTSAGLLAALSNGQIVRLDDAGDSSPFVTGVNRFLGQHRLKPIFIAEDKDGFIYIGAFTSEPGSTLVCLRFPSDGSEPDAVVVPQSLALEVGDPRQAAVTENNLFFTGTRGMIAVRKRAFDKLPPPPAPVLRTKDGGAGTVEIAPGTPRELFLRIGSPKGLLDFPLRWEITVKGSGMHYRETVSNPDYTLRNLPVGFAQVSVRGVDIFDQRSPASVLRILVQPRWYETLWAQMAGGLLLAMLAIAVWQVRLRALQRANLRLEETVLERTNDLQQSNMHLAELSQAKTQLIEFIAHEVSTPLNTLSLSTELMRRPLDEEKRDRYLEGMTSAVFHLRSTIDDLVDINVIESGNYHVRSTKIDLHGMLRRLDGIYGSKAAKKGIQFTVCVDSPKGILLQGDSLALNRVVSNLVSNAIKYTNQGEATLSAEAIPAPGASNPQGDTALPYRLRFIITDTGPGIAPEEQARLFEKHFRGAAGKSQKGTGLGLTIAKAYCDSMGASLTCTSVVGRGTTFIVDCPIEGKPSPQETVEFRRAVNVLIVEDEVDAARALKSVFENLDCVPVVAADGESGLEMLLKHRFDLALVDFTLPGMNGQEMIIEYRKRHPYAQVRFAIMSALPITQVRQRAVKSGVTDFLPKPLSEQDLLGLIEGPMEQENPAGSGVHQGPKIQR